MKQHAFARHAARLALAAAVGAVILGFVGCYYMPGASGRTARAGLVLPRAIPVYPTSAALVVEGPGMDTIARSFTPMPSSISVEVPAGYSRIFTLLLNSVSATLQGVATVDLEPGETREIVLSPELAATQIVVSDYQNSRMVQISDMSGTGWTAKTVADFGVTGTLAPYAVDFDNKGRIYVANNSAASIEPLGGVFRIDDINHTSTFAKVDDTYSSGMKSLAVDRTKGLIYYCSGLGTLYEKSIDSIAAAPITSALSADGLVVPTGMAVDDQGMLYMAVPVGAGPSGIVKYNPAAALGSRVVLTSTGYTFTSPWGVMVRGEYVYASDSGAGKVVRLDKNLVFVDSFGGPTADPFTRPETFLATLDRKITVIDEGGASDRLASFDDMTGAGWTTYGTTGTSTGQFQFYSVC